MIIFQMVKLQISLCPERQNVCRSTAPHISLNVGNYLIHIGIYQDINMKKYICIGILTMFGLSVFCQNITITGCWITESKELPIVECVNEDLINIIDNIFVKEQLCSYFSDSLMLSVEITKQVDTYIILFKSEIKKKKLLEVNPLAFFKRRNHLCFIYKGIPENLFIKTNKKQILNYRGFIPSNKSQKENPILSNLLFEVDDFFPSNWIYIYKDDKFSLLSEAMPHINRIIDLTDLNELQP
jgi:hypothetical protein